MDIDAVQLAMANGGGSFLGICAGIVHEENHYSKIEDEKFNPERREMARMVLEAYGCTEEGWIDKYDNNESNQ
jgi:hypothetical protein